MVHVLTAMNCERQWLRGDSYFIAEEFAPLADAREFGTRRDPLFLRIDELQGGPAYIEGSWSRCK